MKTPRGAWLPNWRGAVLPVGIVVAAEIAAQVFGVRSENLAFPSQIVRAWIVALFDGTLLLATAQTFWSAFLGLLIGTALGLMLGISFGLSRRIYWLLEFTTEAIRPIPSVALIPLVLLIFGFGLWLEASLVAKSTIWPILIMTHAAVAGVEPRLIEVSRALGLGVLARITKIILPASMPLIFVGFRLSVAVSLIVAVTVEIAINPQGLGYAMMRAQETLRPDLMFALLIWVGLLGWSVNAGLLWVQTRFVGGPKSMLAEP